MKFYEQKAEYWYQELLTARNGYEKKLCQRQLNHFISLLGMEKWQPIRDRVRENVKRGRLTKTWIWVDEHHLLN